MRELKKKKSVIPPYPSSWPGWFFEFSSRVCDIWLWFRVVYGWLSIPLLCPTWSGVILTIYGCGFTVPGASSSSLTFCFEMALCGLCVTTAVALGHMIGLRDREEMVNSLCRCRLPGNKSLLHPWILFRLNKLGWMINRKTKKFCSWILCQKCCCSRGGCLWYVPRTPLSVGEIKEDGRKVDIFLSIAEWVGEWTLQYEILHAEVILFMAFMVSVSRHVHWGAGSRYYIFSAVIR